MAHSEILHTGDTRYAVTKNIKLISVVLLTVGALAIGFGFGSGEYSRAWASLLMSNFYIMAIALAAAFFVAVQNVAEVGWSAGIIRIPSAMSTYLPFGTAFMILIFLVGHHELYHWTHEELYDPKSPSYDPILAGKQGYLNMTFYVIRLFAYALIWSGFAWLIRKESLKEDISGGETHYNKNVRLSAIFLVLFAVTESTSAWDILMSVDAHWFSTLFGWYTFAGFFVSGMTVTALITIYLKKNGYLPHINENHIHDLGKFMFAFSVFWTYLWFAQFMLIWYANLPEEVAYFMARQHPSFKPLWLANVFINFLSPFLILMTRDAKRHDITLVVAGAIMLIGHWIDYYLIVMPGVVGSEHSHIGFIEIGTTCFFAGLFMWVTFNSLSKAALVPKNHPMIEESYHFHV